MARASKTLNPLHFEDLDPHRFEDLVRQVIYDFKTWRSLEPTGRLGSDDGYDARGHEIAGGQEETDTEDTDDKDDETETLPSPDRLWQIQCKREKSITPAKIRKYVDEMLNAPSAPPYGVIFAAPCDFSKKTRDCFAQKMRAKGCRNFFFGARRIWKICSSSPKTIIFSTHTLEYPSLSADARSKRKSVASSLPSEKPSIISAP
jgi:hypothetical protein